MDHPEIGNMPNENSAAGARWWTALFLASLLFLASFSAYAAADDIASAADGSSSAEKQQPERGWGIEFGAGFLLHSQGQDASVDATLERGGVPEETTQTPGRVEPALAPGFTLEATVLSPPLFSHKYAPSAFFHVGYQNLLEDSFATFRGIVSDNVSTDFPDERTDSCDIRANEGVYDIEVGGNFERAETMEKRGFSCDLTTGIDTAIEDMWFLGVGVEVPTPIFEERLKIRVALDYLGQRWADSSFNWKRSNNFRACATRLSASGAIPAVGGPNQQPLINNNSCFLQDTEPPLDPNTNEPFVGNSVGQRSQQVINASLPGWTTHSLGVGVSALVDVYEWKELQVRLFLDTRFSWILNDVENSYLVESDYGRFDVNVGPEAFIAQAGGGIRIYWSPRW